MLQLDPQYQVEVKQHQCYHVQYHKIKPDQI